MKTSETTSNIFEAYTKCAPLLKNIQKDGLVRGRKISYKYTTLEKIIEQTKPILADHGLGIIQVPTGNGLITRLVHSSGEWVEQELTSTLIELIGQNMYQVQGSQITYLRRYMWASICGIASDDDMDAQGEEVKDNSHSENPVNNSKVSAAQVKLIQTRISQLNVDEGTVSMLKSHYNVESWNDLPATAMQSLIDWFTKREGS